MIRVLMIGNHPSNKGGMTSVISQIRKHDWKKDNVELSFVPTYIPGNSIKKAFFAIAYIKSKVNGKSFVYPKIIAAPKGGQ